ncbi:hypothetical protein Tco_0446744 [Tanacetum coccineum]
MAALQYKDDHNRIAYLGRERGSEDFTDILSYLDHSPLRYALTHDPPVVFDSLVKQFWATATVRPNAAGSHDLVATIDGREVVVTESLIRAQLQLDDANGIFDMQIDDIFAGMGAIGYPTDRTLTFLKHHLSPQWRFLVHTILHCMSPKAGSWNQFPSSIATALVCLSTADRTPRPTSAFTRKLFSNMRLKWAGEEIPLTPPMLAIAAAGDAADEENAAAHEAAGSTAEAHPAPHSPPFSPVRESTPERQPETEWVVPNPVSPGTDWRRWPSVPAPRPPTPPAQTFSFEEPLVFGPVHRPAGYVDPDTIDPISFGPQPRPYDFVDPALEEPVIFGPLPRPANYIEPEDIDNLLSMEDDTILGGFHKESHAGPNDAPTPTADAAGRAENPALLTSLSAKIDRCMGRIDSLEIELGTSKKIIGGAILTLVSRVKKLERMVKQLRTARLVGDTPATEGDVDIQDEVDLEGLSCMASEALGYDQADVPSEDMEEREEEEVPLRRKRSVYRRAKKEFHTPAFEQKGSYARELNIPADNFLPEDAQVRHRFRRKNRLVTLGFSKKNSLVEFAMQVGSNPALARELLGADVTEENFVERMTAIKERENKKRTLGNLAIEHQGLAVNSNMKSPKMMRNLGLKICGSAAFHHAFNPAGLATPMTWFCVSILLVDSADSSSPSPVSTDHIPIDVLFEPTSGGINEFFLDSDEDEQIGMSRVAADPDSDVINDDSLWDKPVEDFFSSESESDEDMRELYSPLFSMAAFNDGESVASSGWPFVFAVPGQMTHLVASLTLDSARSCVMQGAFLTQGKASNIPTVFSWGDSISPDSFLPPIMLLLVIFIAVVIVVTVVLVVVVGEGSSIIKLSFVIIGSLHRIKLALYHII